MCFKRMFASKCLLRKFLDRRVDANKDGIVDLVRLGHKLQECRNEGVAMARGARLAVT